MSSVLLTYDDLERMTGIPRASWRARVHRRQLPHIRLGPRTVRFREEDVLDWLRRAAVEPDGGR